MLARARSEDDLKLESIAKGALVSVEIEAGLSAGFDDGVQRSVHANCNQMKFKNHEFGE